MEKLQKYFQFSNTITGTTYFLRNALVTFLSYCVGYMVGVSIKDDNLSGVVLGCLLFIPVLWFALSTIYKRMNALFGTENAGVYTVILIVLQFAGTLTEEPINNLIKVILLIIAIVLIFKNSNITNHEG